MSEFFNNFVMTVASVMGIGFGGTDVVAEDIDKTEPIEQVEQVAQSETLDCVLTDLDKYGFSQTSKEYKEYVCKNPEDKADFIVFEDNKETGAIKGDYVRAELNEHGEMVDYQKFEKDYFTALGKDKDGGTEAGRNYDGMKYRFDGDYEKGQMIQAVYLNDDLISERALELEEMIYITGHSKDFESEYGEPTHEMVTGKMDLIKKITEEQNK